MPSALLSIKEYIQTHSTDEVKQRVPKWLQQLRQQQISSMALQALLHHFSPKMEISSTTDAVGFINPDSITSVDEQKLNLLRQQVSGMSSDLRKANDAIKRLINQRRILSFALGALLLVAVIWFVLKYLS